MRLFQTISANALLIAAATFASAQNLVEIAANSPDLKVLNDLVSAAGLGETVESLQSTTLFAPINEAFVSLGEAATNIQKPYNKDLLTETLLYHFVPEVLHINNHTEETEVITLSNDNNLTVGSEQHPVEADNHCVAYVINNVLIPECVGEALGRSIAKLASDAGSFTSLLKALTAAELAGLFDSPSDTGFTVFAPTDDAFAVALDALGVSFDDLANNKKLLTEILTYHVVSGVTQSTDLSEGQQILTLQGENITFSNGAVNNNTIITADLRAYNGIVHVIDGVLLPQSAVEALTPKPEPTSLVEILSTTPSLSTLDALIGVVGLGEVVAGLQSSTVFTPVNEAFDALGEAATNIQKPYNKDLLTNTLLYHVVMKNLVIDENTIVTKESTALSNNNITVGPGAKVNGNDIAISTTNPVPASGNNQAFVIDTVLIPESVGEALGRSIAKLASDAGSFTSLLQALTVAELAGLFDSPSDTGFTVFAPTDDAFAVALDALGVSFDDLANNKKLLTEILTYHVVSGVTQSTDLSEGQQILTLQGENITFSNGA
eukprot:Pgem_evm1s19961